MSKNLIRRVLRKFFLELNAASSSFLQSSGRLRIHPGTALFHPSLPTALLLYLPLNAYAFAGGNERC